jgi:putative transposase
MHDNGVTSTSIGTISHIITVLWRLYTPEQVFTGRYRDIANTRQQALNEQYQRHPERFVKGPPKASLPPTQVVINPVEADPDSDLTTLVNFPTLAAAGATKNTLSSRPVSKTG